MAHQGNSNRRQSDNFLTRDEDGSVRMRFRFPDDDASMMEEAAGDTPVRDWIMNTLREQARDQVKAKRAVNREKLPPPSGRPPPRQRPQH